MLLNEVSPRGTGNAVEDQKRHEEAQVLRPFLPRHRPSSKLVVSGADGTHLGSAVAWWDAVISCDQKAQAIVRDLCPPSDMLRSCLELLLAQCDWMASASGRTLHEVLVDLSTSNIISEEHRAFVSQVACEIARDSSAVNFRVDPIPLSNLIGLIVFLGELIAYRHGTPVSAQTSIYRETAVQSRRIDG